MTIRFLLFPIGLAFAMAVPAAAFADQECLANGKSYKVGQTACLTVSDQSHMARCDLVLNNTSWTKIDDSCPDSTLKPHLHVTPISMPVHRVLPAEPFAN